MLRALFFGYFSTIVVAVALNTGPISAADLNGSCCGDLEQRIAELEATTANKGDRKMSLSVRFTALSFGGMMAGARELSMA